MHGNDLDSVRAALGLEALPYADLAVQRELQQVARRWPLLAEPLLPAGAAPVLPAAQPGPRLLGLHGLRGGCGVTALVAGLGLALQALGQRVLLLDMSPDNQLRHHCGLPPGEKGGWACAAFARTPWGDAAWQVLPGLCLLPYGALQAAEQARLEQSLCRAPGFWPQRLRRLGASFDWVLFDLPQGLPGHAGSAPLDLRLRVVETDPACHLRLQEQPGSGDWLLVNRYDPTRPLQRDLLLLWQKSLGERLLAQCVHDDEALREALAHRLPVGLHAPDSLAADDLRSLATWCLARVARQGRAVPAAERAG